MKRSHRLAVIAFREIRRFAAIAAERAARTESTSAVPSFRPLTDSEAEEMLGGELLAALSGVRRHA